MPVNGFVCTLRRPFMLVEIYFLLYLVNLGGGISNFNFCCRVYMGWEEEWGLEVLDLNP